MHSLTVFVETDRLIKCLCTNFTRIKSLLHVNVHVLSKKLCLSKTLLAHTTDVRFMIDDFAYVEQDCWMNCMPSNKLDIHKACHYYKYKAFCYCVHSCAI